MARARVEQLLGIAGHVLYNGPYKVSLQVSSYVLMGWACVFCAVDIVQRLSPQPLGLAMLVGGGLAYTGGVPFFVRDQRICGVPDHTVWHCFVMLGSGLHYAVVYGYIVTFPYEGWDGGE